MYPFRIFCISITRQHIFVLVQSKTDKIHGAQPCNSPNQTKPKKKNPNFTCKVVPTVERIIYY